MRKTVIHYGFDNGQMLYALMSKAPNIRVWIEHLNGTFFAEWSVLAGAVGLEIDEFCADTWGDHGGLMASAMLATGWFAQTGREFAYPIDHLHNDGVGEIWKLTTFGAEWLAESNATVADT